jgi:hypothetical protein
MTDIKINDLVLTRAGMERAYLPSDVKDQQTTLDGSTVIDIIAQKESWSINYSLIHGTDYSDLMAEYHKAAAVVFSYTDWDGNAVSYGAYMSPPKMKPRHKLGDGTWLLASVEFAIEQL